MYLQEFDEPHSLSWLLDVLRISQYMSNRAGETHDSKDQDVAQRIRQLRPDITNAFGQRMIRQVSVRRSLLEFLCRQRMHTRTNFGFLPVDLKMEVVSAERDHNVTFHHNTKGLA